LVVELAVPEITSGASGDLGQPLQALWPRYFSYAISFLMIAWYWTSHQRIFCYILRADGGLVWLNIPLLLCIAFQPFPTSVLGAYSTTPAVTFYAATLFVTGVADQGARVRLATNRLALDEQAAQPLRGAINRRRQPGRSRAMMASSYVSDEGWVCTPRVAATWTGVG
jgi:uncharacterized membrane protein